MSLKYRNQRNAEIISAYWKKPLDKPDWFTVQAATKDTPAEAFIYGPIGWPFVDESELIRAMAAMKDDHILARINSPGGDVFSGVAIMNAFANHPGGVTVRIESLAASIASVISMGGRKIESYSNALMMIHDSSTIAFGNRIEFLEIVDILEMVDENMMETYCKKTKIGKKEMRDMMHAETWMNAKTMKEKGFIDEIITSGKGAKADFDLSIFANLPEGIVDDSQGRELTRKETERALRNAGASREYARALAAKRADASEDENQAEKDDHDAKELVSYLTIASELKKLTSILTV